MVTLQRIQDDHRKAGRISQKEKPLKVLIDRFVVKHEDEENQKRDCGLCSNSIFRKSWAIVSLM